MSDTRIHRRVTLAQRGESPHVITRVLSGWVVAADRQVVHGYCTLLPDPVVPDLNSLDPTARAQFLADMATLGDVLLEVTGAHRINYETLGNSEPALHAHVIPRYESEPDDLRRRPIWFYDWSQAPEFQREESEAFIAAGAEGLKRRTHPA